MLLAVCQEFEIETESDVIPRIAFGFAGGLGNTGSVCGAVIGAVMAIGLKQGRAKTMEEALRALAVPREFRHRFEAEMKTLKLKWASDAYFTALKAMPELKHYLALGESVVVVINGKALIVADEGVEDMTADDINAFFAN